MTSNAMFIFLSNANVWPDSKLPRKMLTYLNAINVSGDKVEDVI